MARWCQSEIASIGRWLACAWLAILLFAVARATFETGQWLYGAIVGCLISVSIFGVVAAEVTFRRRASR